MDLDINDALNLAVKLIGSGQLSNAALQMKLAQANDTIKVQGQMIEDLMKKVNGLSPDAPDQIPDVPVQPVS